MLNPHELKALAIELAAAMPPERTEIVLATGEALSEEAMRIARAYAAANGAQKNALSAVVDSWSNT